VAEGNLTLLLIQRATRAESRGDLVHRDQLADVPSGTGFPPTLLVPDEALGLAMNASEWEAVVALEAKIVATHLSRPWPLSTSGRVRQLWQRLSGRLSR